MFISFEGVDGCGKSTQSLILKSKLESAGLVVTLTREPGGSELAEKIRALILSQEIHDPLTEYLLFAAARRDHLQKIILPSLQRKEIVICDRYIDSSLAYQSFAKGLPQDVVIEIHRNYVFNLYPDLTLVLDVDFDRSQERSKNRINNFYDEKSKSFFNLLRAAFLNMANEKERVQLIDSMQSIEQTADLIFEYVMKKFKILEVGQ
jgi:dTMP kinase